ncbi:MAG: type IX secretion system sortase PorU, partial [Ignavibacterium sp.]|nr:type IX secretion system sortase PorU [Ignavibacterium sp.]
ILFYGKGPHQWKIPNSPTLANINHQNNIYSDESYYFIKLGGSVGKRIVAETAEQGSPSVKYSTFHDYTFIEKDETNLYQVGQQWFGDNYTIQNKKQYIIPFENIDSSSNIIVRVRGVVESGLSSTMLVKVNDQSLYTLNFPASSGLTHAAAVQNSGQIVATGNSVKVDVEFNNGGNPSVRAFLDYIEVLGKKKLIAGANQFSFRNFDILSTNGLVEFNIGNKSAIDMVWDVSNPFAIKIIKSKVETGSEFLFNAIGGSLKEYVVLTTNYYKPIKLKESSVQNQNLHALKDVDYVIVTQDYLVNQAERLANYHRINSGLKVEVVRLNQIYNEFASGSPDLTGIRDFIKHLYDTATTNKVKYVCLFGDASFDYKNRIGGNNNIVPVFEAFESFNLASSYVTDDYYGMMDEEEGELSYFEKQDVATGRIPVTDVLEAENVVDKILNYYSQNAYGSWRTNVTLIADDIDASGEQVLQEIVEKIADSIAVKRPEFNLKKIYLDAYKQETTSGGKRYPTVNLDILNQVESGTVLVDYFGHGGESGLASEIIFDIPMIQGLKNKNKLPLFVTITCQFSRFDNPLRKTAGEYLFWNKNGGAAALVTTTREIFISVGQSLNEAFIKPLLSFNNENYTVSEALVQTKNQFSTNQRFFIFNIGDPAMNLAAPKPNVKLLKMNEKNISKGLDTIKALSYTKFEGVVTDINDQPLTNFNGELNVVVFDKPILKTTLDNDLQNQKMEFDVLESKLFSGRSKVVNGVFSFDFIAPKDLKIAYGKGKISFYANNTELDKAGYTNDIFIGGINSDAPIDETGPKVNLYLNDLNFVNGENVNESPLLIAVIEDESGVNTSITAVDHDIVAIIDGDVSNPIILNDYYETELDDFKKGKVSYQLRDLAPGFHTITLK